jgi:hypothetical protein
MLVHQQPPATTQRATRAPRVVFNRLQLGAPAGLQHAAQQRRGHAADVAWSCAWWCEGVPVGLGVGWVGGWGGGWGMGGGHAQGNEGRKGWLRGGGWCAAECVCVRKVRCRAPGHSASGTTTHRWPCVRQCATATHRHATQQGAPSMLRAATSRCTQISSRLAGPGGSSAVARLRTIRLIPAVAVALGGAQPAGTHAARVGAPPRRTTAAPPRCRVTAS